MGFKTGIVGLPNVGKSTLFNALTHTSAAQADNYPFCTIEANIGEVAVPDNRLDVLAEIEKSSKAVAARTTFVDIAGLVKGASKGEGLGNRFLANIREVDAIAHVLRCFEDSDVTHVSGTIDPLDDASTVETELMLADIESAERQLQRLGRKMRGGDTTSIELTHLLERALAHLEKGRPARLVNVSIGESAAWRSLGLLTSKAVMYVCNVDEPSIATGNHWSEQVEDHAASSGAACVLVSALIEEEISQLSQSEELEFLEDLGRHRSGLLRMIRVGYELLGLITFFSVGPKEARAWAIPQGTTARDAAGRIHNDFSRGFIRAETVSYEDYVLCNGFLGARDAGKLRSEGRSYIVRDGDVMHVLFNV